MNGFDEVSENNMNFVGYNIDYATKEQELFGVRSLSIFRKNITGKNYKVVRLIKQDSIYDEKELSRVARLEGDELKAYQRWENSVKRSMHRVRNGGRMEAWEVEGYINVNEQNIDLYKQNFQKIFYKLPFYSGYDCFRAWEACEVMGYHIAIPEHRKKDLVIYDKPDRLFMPTEKFVKWERKVIDRIEQCIQENERMQRSVVNYVSQLDEILSKIEDNTVRKRSLFLLNMIADQYSSAYRDYLETRFGNAELGIETLGSLAYYRARKV